MTNFTATQIDEAVAAMTPKGLETMKAIGNLELSFFDEGVVEWSGIWGECLVSEMGHKSSGVVNRLRDLGLLGNSPAGEGDDSDWWYLTALGAAVALHLSETGKPMPEASPAPTYSKTVGRKWTYVYFGDELVMEVQTMHKHLVPNFDNIPNR